MMVGMSLNRRELDQHVQSPEFDSPNKYRNKYINTKGKIVNVGFCQILALCMLSNLVLLFSLIHCRYFKVCSLLDFVF